MRLLQGIELANVSKLVESGIDYGLLEITATGLSKSILDATRPFREFLQAEGLHDYDIQGQGADAKVILPAFLVLGDGRLLESQTSLYRPNTKNGDPRVWFSNLREIADSGTALCVFAHENVLIVLNLGSVDLANLLSRDNDFSRRFGSIFSFRASTHLELLDAMRAISSKGWIKGIKSGSTAVGHLLETELGISANSSKNPDYKGIEIKASAAKAKDGGRVNLFAKVPTWPISPLKSSSEILDNFGYARDADFKLYCTISAAAVNSQGLSFRFSEANQFLSEVSNNPEIPIVANWEESVLLRELANKHGETFWVKARSQSRPDGIYFKYESVTHTKDPVLSQFIPLVLSGDITMDHLIKRNAQGKCTEKGPLFKIQANKMSALFPEPAQYTLHE